MAKRSFWRDALTWCVFGLAISVPLAIAATSPLLAWRDGVYVLAGFAGVVALALLLAQPLLVGGHLAGLSARLGRRTHAWVGAALLASAVVHVGGLWVTSPPDVVDALLFASPTPFSAWGVIAMWAVFAAAALAVLRRRMRIPPRLWRLAHSALAVTIVAGTVIHALLIEGTMGFWSKTFLCVLTVG
ncbi:MAG: ferric reductase-like transmembrane domain-containing protein, partial [Pseudomonadota bacterium]